jgi:hypothetical protein
MGSTTVQRKFRNKGLGRGFFLQISPLSNSEDAASRVEDFEQRLLERLANILSSEKYGESLSIDLPRANRVKGVKYKVVINGKERNDLAIAFNVENVFSVIVCSFFEESWNIHDAIQLASEQAIKIWDNLEIA